MDAVRAEIDALDDRIVALIAERCAKTHVVGLIKAARGDPPVEASRRRQRIAMLKHLAVSHSVDETLVNDVFGVIARWVVVRHEALLNEVGQTTGREISRAACRTGTCR